MDGEHGAVVHTLCDAVAEAVDSDAFLGCKALKDGRAVEDGEFGCVASQGDRRRAANSFGADVLEGDAQRILFTNMRVVGRVAVDGDEGPFEDGGRDIGDVWDLVEASDANGHLAARINGFQIKVDDAALIDEARAMKLAVFADGHIRARQGADFKAVCSDGENIVMTDHVFSWLHTVRHDGTIAKGVVSLPIVSVDGLTGIMGITHGKVADKRQGCNGVEPIVVPNSVVNAHR